MRAEGIPSRKICEKKSCVKFNTLRISVFPL